MSSSRKAKSGRPDLVGPPHRVQRQDAVQHAQRGQRLPLADGDLGDGDLAGVLQRLPEQDVRPGRGALRLEVVRLLEVDRVDLVLVDELEHLDLVAGAQGHVLEVLVGEDDDLAVGQLEALGDVAVLDLFAVDRADPLVLDAAAVGGVHLVEADVLVLGGGVQLHGDADESEGHGSAPDRSHAAPSHRATGRPGAFSDPLPGQDRRIRAGDGRWQVGERPASPGGRTYGGRRRAGLRPRRPRRAWEAARARSGWRRRRTAGRRSRPPSSSSAPPAGSPWAPWRSRRRTPSRPTAPGRTGR